MTTEFSMGARIGRRFRSFAAGAALMTLGLANAGDASAADRVKIEWWNAANGRLAEITKQLISDFNASQDKYELVGISKGNYEETMTTEIAQELADFTVIKAVVDISGQGLGKLALAQAIKSIDGQPPEGIKVAYNIDLYKSSEDGKAWLKAHSDGIP